MNAIDAYSKDGVEGVVVSIIKDKVDEDTFKLGGEVIDKAYKLKKYYNTGVEVPEGEVYYDKNGHILRKIKKGDKLYDKNGKRIGFAFERRLWRYELWINKAQKDFNKGNISKKTINAIDAFDYGESLGKIIGGKIK